MENLEKILNIKIPNSIKNYLNGLEYKIDNIGRSNSIVILYDEYVLKISNLSFDIENEIKISKALKNKLPIPDIIKYEIVDDKIFLLKNKLKGKTLADDYYLKRPDLLYSLATKALKMLWDIDITNLDLNDTYKTIIDFGIDLNNKNLLKIENSDKNITRGFDSFDNILDYLINNKPKDDLVLTHGDLCLPNIICDKDKIVGFIDLGLTGISNRYHDLAILYRSIKYNFNGTFSRKYEGYDDNKLFELLNIKKDEKLINYYLLLDEVLG